LFVGAHLRGAKVITTVKVPKYDKKGAKTPTDGGGDANDEDEVDITDIGKIYPFKAPPKSITDHLERGFKRRAQIKIPVPGRSDLTIDAHAWMDSKLVGISNSAFVGEDHGTTDRNVGHTPKVVDSFVAQRVHAKYYGGVDRLGKGAKEYGVNFSVVPWSRHLVTMMENMSNHASWVIAQYDMKVSEDPGMQNLLAPYKAKVSTSAKSSRESKSTTRGSTKKRAFFLAMTRDIIKLASERIAEGDGAKVARKRPHPSFHTPSSDRSKKQRVGRPTKHRINSEYSKKSEYYCQACYTSIQIENRKRNVKRTQAQVMKGVMSRKPLFTRSGCPACQKRICRVCQEAWKCPE
jgi:hypothetical protein